METAESSAQKLAESASYFEEGEELTEQHMAEVEEMATVCEVGAVEAKKTTKAAAEFLRLNVKDLRGTVRGPHSASAESAELKQKLTVLLRRLSKAMTRADSTYEISQWAKQTAKQRAAAMARGLPADSREFGDGGVGGCGV